MRRGGALATACVAWALSFAPPAHAGIPPVEDVQDARAFARHFWVDVKGETIPCPGVGFRWRVLPRDELAYAYDGGCTVYFNRRHRWGWWKLCATMIHEYGHIIGLPHTGNPWSIMYPEDGGQAWYPRFSWCEYETEQAAVSRVRAGPS